MKIPAPMCSVADRIIDSYSVNPGMDMPVYLSFKSASHECSRLSWYKLRWACEDEPKPPHIDRLMKNTSFKDDMIIDLRRIGCEVSGVGVRINGYLGHVNGAIDALVTGVPEAPVIEHACMFRSLTGKKFRALVRFGLADSQHRDYAQMQLQLNTAVISRGLYLAVCRDTGKLYSERVRFSASEVRPLAGRAADAVNSPWPPARLHDNPGSKAAWQCLTCPARGLCHEGAFPSRNCRTCLHSSAVGGGEWTCALRGGSIISEDEQRVGCESMAWIPSIVPKPWEQVDCNEDTGAITYRTPAGDTMVDGVGYGV